MELNASQVALSLVGVAVGWFLKLVDDRRRMRKEERATIARTVTHLLQLHAELTVLTGSLESIKEDHGITSAFERQRARLTSKHLFSGDLAQQLAVQLEELGAFLPVPAVRIRELVRMLRATKDVKLDAVATVPTAYVHALSSLEASLLQSSRAIRRQIVSLAWLHAFMTWMGVRRYLRERERNGRYARAKARARPSLMGIASGLESASAYDETEVTKSPAGPSPGDGG